MDFGHLEERRSPLTGRLGAGNRRRRAAWDQRGMAAELADSDDELAAQGLGRGGRTRSNNRPTAAERRQINAAKKAEAAHAKAVKDGKPANQIKRLEKAAENAARKVTGGQGKGGRRAW